MAPDDAKAVMTRASGLLEQQDRDEGEVEALDSRHRYDLPWWRW
jgi:hypothetical protein